MFSINKLKIQNIIKSLQEPKIFIDKPGQYERCQICKGIPIAPVLECSKCQSQYFCKQCVEDKTECQGCKNVGTRPMNRNIMQMTLEKITFSHECF